MSTRSEAERAGTPAVAERRSGSWFVRHFLAADSYTLVLLLIVISYALAVSIEGRRSAAIVLFAQIVSVWFALRTAHAHRRVLAVAGAILIAAAVIGLVELFVGEQSGMLTAVFFVSCLLYTIAPIVIVRHIAFRDEVDRETVIGAICAYLFIGMAFAFVYRALGELQRAPAFFGANGEGTVSQHLFFSFTTLSTTGYGNLVPAGQPGQSLAVSEMILGQLFLVTAVGKVISVWRPRGRRKPED